MAQFRHPNITSLYGVVSKDEPVIRDLLTMTPRDCIHVVTDNACSRVGRERRSL